MFYDHFWGLNSFRLTCIIACFIILFKNKFYFGYFKKKYEEVSFIWLFFTLILMISFPLFMFSFITMILMLPILLFLITLNVLHVGFDFRKRKKMSISEFIYFPFYIRYFVWAPPFFGGFFFFFWGGGGGVVGGGAGPPPPPPTPR